jgi:hypothetical protein
MSRLSAVRILLIGVLLPLLAVFGRTVETPGQGEGTDRLLVDLDARDTSAGTDRWRNRGSLGAFQRVGGPSIGTIGGVGAVLFNGRTDAYRGPSSVAALEGNAPRTVEVWVYNPRIDSPEETMVAWGKRGGPEGANFSFNYGDSPTYGAATHWAVDLGWNGVPHAGQWHHLVYTYDGRTVRVYDNAAEKSARAIVLHTAAGLPIELAAQNDAEGRLQFRNEFNQSQLAGSLWIAVVRIHAVALTPEQIAANFRRDADRFHAVPALTAETLPKSGVDRFDTPSLTLALSRVTRTAAALFPRGSDFNFLPGDRLAERAGDGFYHLGDITLRVRVGDAWKSYSSAATRAPIRPKEMADVLAACDLTPGLGADCPVAVERQWVQEQGQLALRFRLSNPGSKPVEIGAFGAAMVFNNLLTDRPLDEAHTRCAFADPCIGGPAGYLQVTRLNGQGPVLLVLPEAGTSFEAYRPLRDDLTPRSITFEGFYEWMVHTQAYLGL